MVFRTPGVKCALLAALSVLVMGFASRAAADSITLQWDPAGGTVGYRVHVGTQSGSYSQHFDVGSATLYTFPTAVAGQRYCFAVSSYLMSSYLEGPNSTEVCGYSNAPPTLVNPGNRTSAVGQYVTLQLIGSDPASQPLTYSATGLPPGLSLMASTGYISGAGTTAGTYSVTARASDGLLTASQTFTWVIGTSGSGSSSSDTSPPQVSIGTPTSAPTFSTASATIAVSGAGADNIGVAQVRWSNDRGGSGIANDTNWWSVSAIPLQSGANVITITAFDAAGNQGSDSITVTYTGTSTSSDTTVPSVTIGWPTSGTTFSATSPTFAMSGAASDNIGVTQVWWSSDRGGSGIGTGTTSWSFSGIPLQIGTNMITITAYDAAGNRGTDTLAVVYATSSSSSDAIRPTVSIGQPTSNAGFTTTSSTVTMSGAAADNIGVTQVRWSSDRGGSGIASGTAWWSVSGIPLQSGNNVITITAYDAAGNPGSASLIVAYSGTSYSGSSDAIRPTISIGSPTGGDSYSTSSSTITMTGAATDNVGVTQVRWSSDRGGSGVGSGTQWWTLSGIPIQYGTNVITVTAVDAAGNQGSDVLTVYR
jgi:hypothetical protein